jgi:hypothetical protein
MIEWLSMKLSCAVMVSAIAVSRYRVTSLSCYADNGGGGWISVVLHG